ncbi:MULTISPECIES: FixH family protein [Weeksellaceae]|uniref:FixH family protein n=1 Tax=Weeksellaceae TaxID=2762318 RepID=UPI0025C0A4BE|nr:MULTISPECIES: FixH family protein [Weeksellaceae]
MKFTWGHGVVVALGCFIIFILSLLYFAGETGGMVTDNYYEKELHFQDEINSEKRANALKEKPEVIVQANGFLFQFPVSTSADFSGDIYLLRNEDETKDIKETIKLNDRKNFLISSVKLKDGVYELTLNWKENNQTYLIKKSIRWISQ